MIKVRRRERLNDGAKRFLTFANSHVYLVQRTHSRAYLEDAFHRSLS